MDLDAGVWTIPGARMKAKRDHRVPLSGRALAILHDAQRRSDGTGLVFRSLRGKPLSNTTLSKLIKELGIAAVPHGFRSSFRDWAAERTSTPREVVEAALAHTVQNPTEAAYARSDLFERRRRLMDDWAAYLSEARELVEAFTGRPVSFCTVRLTETLTRLLEVPGAMRSGDPVNRTGIFGDWIH